MKWHFLPRLLLLASSIKDPHSHVIPTSVCLPLPASATAVAITPSWRKAGKVHCSVLLNALCKEAEIARTRQLSVSGKGEVGTYVDLARTIR